MKPLPDGTLETLRRGVLRMKERGEQNEFDYGPVQIWPETLQHLLMCHDLVFGGRHEGDKGLLRELEHITEVAATWGREVRRLNASAAQNQESSRPDA